MGRPKLLLPLGSQTVLEHVIAGLQAAGVERILVVASPHLPELVNLSQSAGAQAVLLPDETPDMRSTVEFGLTWIEREWSPGPGDAWLLVPADHPTVEPGVIKSLVQARQDHPDRSVFIPIYQGRRGHPALIGWQHVAAIRAFPAGEGLSRYVREQAAQTLEVAVGTDSILCDLDTPEEYKWLLSRIAPR